MVVYLIYYNYSFKKCPLNISEEKKYSITGGKNNIITKLGSNGYWMGKIYENELDKSKNEHIFGK